MKRTENPRVGGSTPSLATNQLNGLPPAPPPSLNDQCTTDAHNLAKTGFVYLIHARGTHLYKIGYTTREPSHRLSRLQTGCPHRLDVVKWRAGSRKDEKDLHRLFAEHSRHGEWFEFKTLGSVLSHFRGSRVNTPKAEKVWNRDSIAQEIAHQIIAYALMIQDAEARRQFPGTDTSNFWYAVADHLEIDGPVPKLTDELRCEILKLWYACQDADRANES